MSISILGVLFFVLLVVSWGKLGSLIIDCFRNAYLPAELLKGNLLYRDIFHYYCPLVPYWHMGLFKIFGVHLNVLYTAGATLSFLMTVGIYYLSRQLLPVWAAFALVVLVMTRLIFYSGIFQFIFPYSFEALYGSFFILLTTISIVLYLKKQCKKDYWLILAAVFTTITAFIKQDTALAAYITLFCSFIYLAIFEKVSVKKLCVVFLLPLILPMVIYGVIGLFFIPFPFLLEGLFPFDKIDPYLYKHSAGSFVTIPLLFYTAKVMGLFLLRSLPVVALLFGLHYVMERYLQSFKTTAPLIVFMVCAILLFLGQDSLLYLWLNDTFNVQSFSWMGFVLLGEIIYYGYRYAKNPQSVTCQEKWLLLFCLWGLASIFRTPFSVRFTTPIAYYLYLPFIGVFYFFFCELARLFKPALKPFYQRSIWTYILLLAVVTTIINLNDLLLLRQYAISNERGTFYTKPFIYKQFEEAISLTEELTNPNDLVAVFPEEVSINYFANRSGGTRFFQTLPGALKSEKEEKLLTAELAEKKPKLIFVTTRESPSYSKNQWGVDYHLYVHRWIQENYSLLSIIQVYWKEQNIILPYKMAVYILPDSLEASEEGVSP